MKILLKSFFVLFLMQPFVLSGQAVVGENGEGFSASLGLVLFQESIVNDLRLQNFDVNDVGKKVVVSPAVSVRYSKNIKSSKYSLGVEFTFSQINSTSINRHKSFINVMGTEVVDLESVATYLGKATILQSAIQFKHSLSRLFLMGEVGVIHSFAEEATLNEIFTRYYFTFPNSLPRYVEATPPLITTLNSVEQVYEYDFTPTAALGLGYRLSEKLSVSIEIMTFLQNPKNAISNRSLSSDIFINYHF